MKVTAQRLREINGGTCYEIEYFEAHFGPEAEVTEERCIEHAKRFNWNWAGRNLLTPEASDEYMRVEEGIWSGYQRELDKALGEYRRACALAFCRLSKEVKP